MSVSDLKKTAAELKKLPSELEKDSSLITLKIHEFKDKVFAEFEKYKKDNDAKIKKLIRIFILMRRTSKRQ